MKYKYRGYSVKIAGRKSGWTYTVTHGHFKASCDGLVGRYTACAAAELLVDTLLTSMGWVGK